MKNRIVRAAEETPDLDRDSGTPTGGLQGPARRLELLVGAVACAEGLFVLSAAVVYGGIGWRVPGHLQHFLTMQLVLLALSLGFWWLVRRGGLAPEKLLRLGLLYEVAGALVISACAFYGDMLLQPVMVKLSWLAVWILLFPLFVPAPPWRSLLASLLSASTAPLVFFTWATINAQGSPGPSILAHTFLPYYVCAVLSVLPAYLVYRLERDLGAAQGEVRRLGSYELGELLGRGAMGEVWQARHRMLARPAAVKLIRGEAWERGDDEAVARDALTRFQREANATAALTSPHTVTLYDYGLTEDGTLYYAMELLEGVDLQTLVDRFGPVSPARAVHFLRQACASLAEAHRAGMVHRDVKPANIYVCRVGLEVDFIKLLDFGLVTRPPAPSTKPLDSDPGYIIGTPAFMAPELIRERTEVDGRADLYALGCVAHWLLTGRTVFEMENVADAIVAHLHAPPRRVSLVTSQPVPPELERVILSCLEKDPERRPASAEALDRSLAAIPLGEPWSPERARLWWQARRPEGARALARAETATRAELDLEWPDLPLLDSQEAPSLGGAPLEVALRAPPAPVSLDSVLDSALPVSRSAALPGSVRTATEGQDRLA